jgi:hypothetical protein
MLVDDGQIFGESVQDVANEVGVEKLHRRVHHVGYHVFVDIDRGASHHGVEAEGATQVENCGQNDHCSEQIEDVVTFGGEFAF